MDVTDDKILIRGVLPEDAEEIAGLLAELGYPDNDAKAIRRRVAVWTREQGAIVLVAEAESRAVGVIAMAAVPYFEREGRWARVVALVVAEGLRGRGVGRRLLEEAEETAREYGCRAVELTSRRSREEAHAFYEKLGYADRCETTARFHKLL